MQEPWTDVVAAKRAIRSKKLAKWYPSNGNVTDPDFRIVEEADVQALTSLLETRKTSAEAIVLAYIKMACKAQEKTNCLTEICFDEALEQARSLDVFQREHGRLKGPLHGIPISLKDQFNVKGLDSTLGYVARAFAPASSDAVLVEVLRRLGAVIIAKSNLPQSIMWCETENPLWGLTTHPMNENLTPGGSSGGEGALLALKGSVIGWGTDIGGSIRIPSHMNGLWGLKPSSGRMPYEGVAVSQEGQQHVPSVVGPMARSLSSLTLVTKAVIDAAVWELDTQVLQLPWRDDIFKEFSQRRLVVGTMMHDGMVKVHPPIERVFKEVSLKLQAAGHEIVEWDASLNAECITIMDEYYTADGGEDIRRAITAGGEPFIPHVQALINRAPSISVYDYWQLNKRKLAAQQAYHKMWSAVRSPSGRPVDILLVPTMPHTTVPHRSCRWVGYTKVFNFIDYVALSFPAGKACKDLDGGTPLKYAPRNPLDAWNWEQYDIDKMDGHHIGLQIVGRRLEEEKVLGAAQQIQHLI
ncbi:amidase [Trichoderma velutinum]